MEFIVKPQNFQLPEPLALDCGRTLKGVNIRYETVGTLAPDRSNAILITHALSGDAHVCGRHAPEDPKPGWWDEMVGPGRAIDTNRYFVICSNVLGSCAGSTGPRSVNPDTGNPYNLDFPVITIRDMVRAQRYLIDYLGIEKLLSVVGGSMGGMQAMEWAINYPDRLDSAVPIATTSQLSPQSSTGSGARRSSTIRTGTTATIRPTMCRTADLPQPGCSRTSPISPTNR